MALGKKTSNIMDVPVSVSSVFSSYVGDNGYGFEGSRTIYVLSVANGTLGTYDETSGTNPFGTVNLVVPDEQTLTLAYNKSMLLRIQKSQIQDIPVSRFAKDTALQQVDEVFIPAHDAYSLMKVFAARPSGNIVALDATKYSLSLKRAVNKAKKGGAKEATLLCWVTFDFSAVAQDQINFTGSDAGFNAGKNGYLGKLAGVACIEIPDEYLPGGVHALLADKRAIVNVTPKMDPKKDMVVIETVPLFSGIEIQLRDRADTFVLNKKARMVATLETAASTTTTTAS